MPNNRRKGWGWGLGAGGWGLSLGPESGNLAPRALAYSCAWFNRQRTMASPGVFCSCIIIIAIISIIVSRNGAQSALNYAMQSALWK